MTKRVCYIHIGPHKTGTSSIQWFLKENRMELLKYGYFVPESGARHGGHHGLVRKLCGQDLRDNQQSAATDFARGLDATPSEAVIVSAEVLEELLRNRDYAVEFFTRIRELNLEPTLVRDIKGSHNEGDGPFTVSVARSVMRLIDRNRNQLKWLQAVPFGTKLPAYLEENGWADSGYCGLTTALARQIESEFRPDNDVFAQHIWGKPWAEVFADDILHEFTPNDFDKCPMDESTERQLGHAIREMTPIVEQVLLDPALAVEAPRNDLLPRDV